MTLLEPENVLGAAAKSPESAGGPPGATNGGRLEDHEELDGFLQGAIRHLEIPDLAGAELLLEKASVKATSMWLGSRDPALPQPLTDLNEFRENLRRLKNLRWRTPDPHPLAGLLKEIRSQFGDHAHFAAG